MNSMPLAENEDQRLAALHALGILDTPAEERFDRITRLAGALFDVPIALISLVDQDRQWFKSRIGLDVAETDRCVAFCAHAIMADEALVVENAASDERFRENPLVTGPPGIGFYAGQPLRAPGGERIGTLCIIDLAPRQFGVHEQARLRDLALLAETELSRWSNESLPLEHPFPSADRRRRWRRLTSGIATRGAALLIAFLVSCAVLAIGSRWDAQNLAEYRQSYEVRVLEILGIWRGRLESELNTRLHLVHGLAGLVHAEPEVSSAVFQRFAAKMAGDVTAIRSLQLAPRGIVQHVWPLESNRQAIGHDLLADPARRAAAEAAIVSRDIWIAGPLQLIQGGVALIGRRPIFLPGEDPSQRERFWGFATILIDLPEFMRSIGMPRVHDGIHLALRGVDAQGARGEVFFGSRDVFSGEDLRVKVALPEGTWELAAQPVNGWTQTWPGQALFRIILLAAAVAIGCILFLLLRLPAQMRARVDEALASRERGERQFSDAVEALQEGFAIYDSADRLSLYNQRFAELYDVCQPVIRENATFAEITRYGIINGQFAHIEAENPADIEEALRTRLALHRRPEIRFEEQLRDGRWLQVVERQIRNGGTVTFHLDITELKEKEQQLIEARERAEIANAAKSSFLATVSHEVRTPLNSVLGLLGLLRDSSELPPRERERALTAHDSARHLLMILNEILDISKMEENRLELESVPFCPAETAASVVQLVDGLARRKNLPVHLDAAGGQGCYVLGDEGRFRQILLNIVSNAIKFTDQGHVTITLATTPADNDQVLLDITVLDTGIGFDSVQAAQLFEPFSQLENQSSRRFEGTGLGLAICRRLVDLMGGSLTASGTPGVGASFRLQLTLPAAAAPGTMTDNPMVADARTPNERGWRNVRVLLVEDSGTNQMVFQAMLEGTGYVVDVAASGEEALRALPMLPYDLVMMDVFMPGMDGLETTRALRQMECCRTVPVIALTANAMQGDRERYLEAGMDDYLPKPIDKRDLLVVMAYWAAQALERENESPVEPGDPTQATGSKS